MGDHNSLFWIVHFRYSRCKYRINKGIDVYWSYANGYSNDLRQRILAYYDDNHAQKETCEVFGISRSALTDWLKLHRETGSANLRPRPKTRKIKKIDEEQLKAYIEQHPDAYFHDIASAFDVVSAIHYACRHGITRKKADNLLRS